VTEAQIRELIRQRRRAVLAVRGRQTRPGAWVPLLAMLGAAAIAVVLRLH
jgi:hypothetical protein